MVFGAVILVGFIVCGLIYKNLRDTANKMYTPVAKSITSNKNRSFDNLLATKKPINILLLGTDTGALGRDWRGRTDTIMMLSINPNSNKTTIVSIPRDSNAIFPDYSSYGVAKINAAYTLGGVSETIKTLDKYYSVPIDGYILINMGGLEKAISPSTLVNNSFLNSISNEMQTDLTMEQMYKIGMDYRRATNNLSQDHAQGTSKMTDNPKFGQMEIEVISQEERQRISDKIRSTLDINKVQVNEERASYVMNN